MVGRPLFSCLGLSEEDRLLLLPLPPAPEEDLRRFLGQPLFETMVVLQLLIVVTLFFTTLTHNIFLLINMV